MILEELSGSCVALASNVVIPTPSISRDNVLQENWSIRGENNEDEEEYNGLVHCEYERHEPSEAPYYEDGSFVLLQSELNSRRSFCESLRRSFRTNIGILMVVVFMLSTLTVGIVYIDLNTTDICIEWMNKNITLPSHVKTLKTVGMSLKLLPLFAWFPSCVAMLWGLTEFKKELFLAFIHMCVSDRIDNLCV